MSISIRCPACGVALRVDDSPAGRKVRCSGCNKPFTAGVEPPDDEPEDDLRPAKRPSSRRPAVDQPLIPKRVPRDPDEERPKPVPVWKREMMGAGIYFGCIGAFFLAFGGGALIFFFVFQKTVTPLVTPPLAKSELDAHMDNLEDLDPDKRAHTARRLRASEPNVPRRDEVARALANRLEDSNPTCARTASEALVVWATPNTAPDIAAALPNLSPEVRRNCLEALQKIGPPAEQSILGQLRTTDKKLRRDLCALLGRIGTNASLPMLECLASTDADPVVKRTASGAIRAIQERNP